MMEVPLEASIDQTLTFFVRLGPWNPLKGFDRDIEMNCCGCGLPRQCGHHTECPGALGEHVFLVADCSVLTFAVAFI